MARTSPTFRRRRLARRVRQLREEAGMTQEKAAAGLDMSTSALSRKETGEVATSVHEIRSMMDLYDAYDPTCSTSRERRGNAAGGGPTAWRTGVTSTWRPKPVRCASCR
ncbi:helix-turn-helix domain-containing protein [Saccharopolyspora hattusasensis]|uniref:helix-turn-helix domain-containing protein n=1 Tax=Saccharopolyspora hattusasensis TaxID=1128679 RepID=UPI003D975381